MPVQDGPNCPGCGLPNYSGLCPHCRGDQDAYERELVPPFPTSIPEPQPPTSEPPEEEENPAQTWAEATVVDALNSLPPELEIGEALEALGYSVERRMPERKQPDPGPVLGEEGNH